MKNKRKAAKNLAMAEAFQNAAEMIRSHGEEGFSFDDELFANEYRKAVIKVSDKLNSLSKKYISIYSNTRIEINSSCDGISDVL